MPKNTRLWRVFYYLKIKARAEARFVYIMPENILREMQRYQQAKPCANYSILKRLQLPPEDAASPGPGGA